MFHEKLSYYRKKNMLTQEELAEKLNVSRQTITKWENGSISPSVEYLIAISNLFGITIDYLLKEDDCIAHNTNHPHTNTCLRFLIEAKKATYAGKKGKIPSIRRASQDYAYTDSKYTYCDSFFGSSKFSGQEVLYEDENVIWSMNYYGKVLSNRFHGDFLKEALLHVDLNTPYRGPACYQKGEYTYISKVWGCFDSFKGSEEIYYQTNKVYEGLFHGGTLE